MTVPTAEETRRRLNEAAKRSTVYDKPPNEHKEDCRCFHCSEITRTNAVARLKSYNNGKAWNKGEWWPDEVREKISEGMREYWKRRKQKEAEAREAEAETEAAVEDR